MARADDAKGGCGLTETEPSAVSGRIPLTPGTRNPQQFHFLSRGSPGTSGSLKCPPESAGKFQHWHRFPGQRVAFKFSC